MTTIKRGRGRPPTGCPKWDPELQVWIARILQQSGGRKPVPMPGITEHEVERAHAKARQVAEVAISGGYVPEEALETVNEWFKAWTKAREAKGLVTVRNDRGRYGKWVSPVIGTKPMAHITRRDVEEVVQALDLAVRAGSVSWKTATNVWGVVTKMFSDACRSKVLSLRCREDNPARDVEGPDRGVERSGPYLFPSEFASLMRCERVPARWKRIFMLATYLYVRGGELEALEWNSVSFEHGYVLIHQSVDADTGEVKPTKTKDVRKVPIEPALLPLLRKMHEEAAGEGRVVAAMPPREEWAERLRKYLGWASVTRADLFADDATRRQLSFHDLRHTGITWRAVRGDEPLKVMRAAGHDDLRTTQRYINEAQTFEGPSFGEPFPTVPLELLSIFGSNTVSAAQYSVPNPLFSRENPASPGGISVCGYSPPSNVRGEQPAEYRNALGRVGRADTAVG
jgi:integrase